MKSIYDEDYKENNRRRTNVLQGIDKHVFPCYNTISRK